MSRILFLSQLLPYPLDAGPKTREYYVLRHLVRQHDVTLVCFIRPNDPPLAVDHVRQACSQMITVPMSRSRVQDGLALIRSLLSRRSWIITRDDHGAMRAALQRLMQAKAFDFIHADQLWMAQYALFARQSAGTRPSPRMVLDQHNAVFMIPQRMADNTRNPLLRRFLHIEAQRLARYEVQTCQQFDQVVWVTREDYQAVAAQLDFRSLPNFGNLGNTVIPICVDPAAVRPNRSIPATLQVLFVGGFHWPPNVQGVRWFIQEVLPRLRARIPGVRFCAVGKLPPKNFLTAEGVTAPGYVDDLEPYYAQSRAFIVPLLAGGGIRVKILDAWMRGLPVVSTRIGAEGINYTDGQDIAIADNPDDFADHLFSLLSKDEDYLRLGQSGRETVMHHYNWEKIYPSWDKIYTQ
jgi:glycosyltransferase involved in cell wall biosynthesis